VATIGLTIVLFIVFVACVYIRSKRLLLRSVQHTTALEVSLAQSNLQLQQLEETLQSLQDKLHHINEDPITHALGRPLFEDRLGQTINECERYNLILGVFCVDIDNFNRINQALGHEVGDLLLQEVASRLQGCIRKVDSLSRFGNDTFVVLLSQLAKPEAAAIVAQRILESLGLLFQIKEHEFYITVSIGIALFPTDGSDVQTLLYSANHAMRLAKEKAHHSYQFFQARMQTDSQRELILLTGINSESCLHEFELYYHPIVNIETKTVVCMDVLLQWRHPTLGLVGFDELMRLAMKQQKANAITEWLLRAACQQFMEWGTRGFNPQMLGLPLAIRQLENSRFIYHLSQIMQTLQFKPEWLLLEIKESVQSVSFDILEKAFNMLSYLGVSIAIEHFGVGAFSLQQLKKFPIHYLKLDGSLIEDILQQPQTTSLVNAVAMLANSLAMQLIIDGVKSQAELALLKESGCTIMQGQLFGGAMSEQDVMNKLIIPAKKPFMDMV